MSHDASGRTDTKKKTTFRYFQIIWKKVSHDASGRTDTKKERKPFLFFYILIFMIFKYVCFPF